MFRRYSQHTISIQSSSDASIPTKQIIPGDNLQRVVEIEVDGEDGADGLCTAWRMWTWIIVMTRGSLILAIYCPLGYETRSTLLKLNARIREARMGFHPYIRKHLATASGPPNILSSPGQPDNHD